MTMATVKGFIDKPDIGLVEQLTKEQFIELATHYSVALSYESKRRRCSIVSVLVTGLVEKGIIPKPDYPPKEPSDSSDGEPTADPKESGVPHVKSKDPKTQKSPVHSKQDHEYRMQHLLNQREELACCRRS